MENFDIMKTDFHALRVLAQIHESGSLTKAAQEIGLTQSTLSHTLERMRLAFDDSLFVRHGRGLVPTERCDKLVPQIRRLLEDFDLMARPHEFDPANSSEQVTIACNHYERVVILPTLVKRIHKEAPNVRVKVIPSGSGGHAALLKGDCDVLLSPVSSSLTGLMTRNLLSEKYVCILNKNDPRAKNLTLEEYRNAEHIVVDFEYGWTPLYIPYLRERGIKIKCSVELPSYGSVSQLMENGPFLMTVPSRLVRDFEPTCMAVPAPFSIKFDLKVYWSARQQDSPIHSWLRNHIIAAAREVPD